MKLIKILAIVLISISSIHAQSKRSVQLDENTIVRDPNGQRYEHETWRKLMSTGYYILSIIDKSNPQEGYYLVKMTEEEKERREKNAPKPRETSCFTTGKSIDNFKEKDIEGTKWDLNNLKGKIVVLNFWFINCPPCRQEIPALNSVVDTYAQDSGIVFISLCLDDKESIKEFLQENPFKYKVIDNTKFIARGNGVISYPTHVVLDQEGKVQYHTTGLSTGTIPWLKKTIEQLRKNNSNITP